MVRPYDFGGVQLDVEAGRARGQAQPKPETPFRIGILGDFGGWGNRGVVRGGDELAAGRAHAVDIDDLDRVMERVGAELELPAVGRIRFRSIEDFHPDSLCERVVVFRRLREARVEIGSRGSKPARTVSPRAAPAPTELSLRGLLDQSVEETESRAEGRRAGRKDPLQAWIEEKVAPHLEAATDPRQAELEELIERATEVQMRALLHVPDFQALEAAWRGVEFVARRVETGPRLKIHVVDVSKEELRRDLGSVTDVLASGLARMLEREQAGGPWGLLAGNYTFGATVEDAGLLGRLGAIGKAFGAPFVGGADGRLAGIGLAEARGPVTVLEAWGALRRSAAAAYIGLAFPRFLLRLPYGKETQTCERLALEEMGGRPEPSRYLWGNAALLCAYLLAESFSEAEWGLRPGLHRSVGGLPLHVYKQDGETEVRPCTEAVLTERGAEELLERGVMPVVWIRGSDEVRLVRFQSIAEPSGGLAGRWE